MECPCKGCTERWVEGIKTCHATCERYAKWKKWRDDIRHKEYLDRVSYQSVRTGYWVKKDGFWRNSKIVRRRK